MLKKAFTTIGYKSEDIVTQISSALATIGQKMGDLRNEIGTTSHGRPVKELKARNESIDVLTREFLVDSTVLVACFLISAFETENPRVQTKQEIQPLYNTNDDFNEYFDGIYGEVEIGSYSYPASEVLFYVDYTAYSLERETFEEEFMKDL